MFIHRVGVYSSVSKLSSVSSVQGPFNCGILVSGIGGSGDPRRKWEEMESERGREREKRKREVLLLFAK